MGTFFASCISTDGSTAVGTASTPTGNEPIVWRDGALTLLGGMEGQEHVFAQAISADGSTVVGEDYNVIAYRWREATGYTSLSPLGIACATSADGSIVVGQSHNGAFRWAESTGPQYITAISGGGLAEAATDVSLDGSVLVGSGAPPTVKSASRIAEMLRTALSRSATIPMARRKAPWPRIPWVRSSLARLC